MYISFTKVLNETSGEKVKSKWTRSRKTSFTEDTSIMTILLRLRQGNVLQVCVILLTGGLASQHASQVTWPASRGVSFPASITGLHPWGLPTEGVCQHGGLHPGGFAYLGGWADPQELRKQADCILLECFLFESFFERLEIMVYNSSLDTQHWEALKVT